jgi:hypothetical protein
MYSERVPIPEIREIGGESLEGSGFETDDPATGFESYERSAEEGGRQ